MKKEDKKKLLWSSEDVTGMTSSGTCELAETLDNFSFIVLVARSYVLISALVSTRISAMAPYPRASTSGYLNIFCVRGNYVGKTLTLSDIGRYDLRTNSLTSSTEEGILEIWGIR